MAAPAVPSGLTKASFFVTLESPGYRVEGTMRRLVHDLSHGKTDEQLADEASAYLKTHAVAQIVAELLALAMELETPWFTPRNRHECFGTNLRVYWLDQRRDIRACITAKITGLGQKTAYPLARHEQVKLIELALSQGEADLRDYDQAFDPATLVVYGDANAILREIVNRFPWESNEPPERKFIAKALQRLMAKECCLVSELQREPFVTPTDAQALYATLVNSVSRDAKIRPKALKPLFEKLTKALSTHTSRAIPHVASSDPVIEMPPASSPPSSSSAGIPPPPSSGSGLFLKHLYESEGGSEAFLAVFEDKTGIKLIDVSQHDPQTLAYMCVFLVSGLWPPEESRLRRVIIGFLTALKPDAHRAEELGKRSTDELQELFFEALRKLKKTELSDKLKVARNKLKSTGSA